EPPCIAAEAVADTHPCSRADRQSVGVAGAAALVLERAHGVACAAAPRTTGRADPALRPAGCLFSGRRAAGPDTHPGSHSHTYADADAYADADSDAHTDAHADS
ncbi:MAG: hypothetical protein KDB60_20815, partial [Propionibacteriaceae bacterium]|nr:hypothetical protein [Propionibacteriaceae bacterium]